MIEKTHTCCFTGHRFLSRETAEALAQRLDRQITDLIAAGYTDFITGGATGFDTLAAQAVLRLREKFPQIRLILAQPCRDQDKLWAAADRKTYQEILEQADRVHCLQEAYTADCMLRRNQFMVNRSSVCIFYLTRLRSGTYQTVRYAMDQGLRLCNILE